MGTLRQENKSIYWAWKSMKQRCLNPRCAAYKNYGARGITICEEWMEFEPFCEWALNNGHKRGLDLDRRDNSGGYSPENCRWITRQENTNNRRKTIFLEVDGVRKARTDWERQLGLPRGILKQWFWIHGHEYTVSRIKKILKSGYVPKDYSYSHGMAVTHVETGRTYRSIKEAARNFGVSPGKIRRALSEDGKTGKGSFVWAQVDEKVG